MQSNSHFRIIGSSRQTMTGLIQSGKTVIWIILILLILRWEAAVTYILFRFTEGGIFWIKTRAQRKPFVYDCGYLDGPGFYTTPPISDLQILGTILARPWSLFVYVVFINTTATVTGNQIIRSVGILLTLGMLIELLPLASRTGGRIVSILAYSWGLPNKKRFNKQHTDGVTTVIDSDVTIESRYLLMLAGWAATIALSWFIRDSLVPLLIASFILLDFFRTVRSNFYTDRSLTRRQVFFSAGVYLFTFVALGIYTWYILQGTNLTQTILSIFSDNLQTLLKPFLPIQ